VRAELPSAHELEVEKGLMTLLSKFKGFAWISGVALLFLSAARFAGAQQAQPRRQIGFAPAATTPDPKANAPQDLTGYWVAIVTEDWRYRMLTPEKGDYPGIFLTPAGQQIANAWDPDKDIASGNACKSYGAAAIMRIPTRLHITWQDDQTLKVETDAGQQTRLFHFNAPAVPAGTAPSLQGFSIASWEGLSPRGFVLPTVASGIHSGNAKPVQDGYLKVVTTDLRPGYIRKNGVPYGERANVEEYFDSFREENGDTWLVVTSIVTDPQYLAQNYITSSQFKKLDGPTGWNPTPCEAK
jgi:hypothetical protein